MKLKWWSRVALAVVALGVTAGPAFADCINVSRSDTANGQIAAQSWALPAVSCFWPATITPCAPFITLDQALLIDFETPADVFPGALGLCKAGAEYLLGTVHVAAASAGLDTDFTLVVGGMALQSGGLFNATARAQGNLVNGKGIDLFGQYPAIMDTITANLATATEMC